MLKQCSSILAPEESKRKQEEEDKIFHMMCNKITVYELPWDVS